MTSKNAAIDWITWSFSPTISAILVTLVISLILPFLIHIYLYSRSASKELPTFLLVGPSGAGKTTLLTLFANGSSSSTQISQEPQSAECKLSPSIDTSEDRYRSEHDTSARTHPRFALLDTPGHGKLRHHAISSLTSPRALKGLLFVVDSAAVSSPAGLTEAAEYLHDVLLILQKRHTQGKTAKDPRAIPVLVVANKQDVFTSIPATLVKKRLEEEIAKVRLTRSRGLLDSGVAMEDGTDTDEEQNWLGEYGAKAFKFAQLEEHGIDVAVIGGNAKGEDDEARKLAGWLNWIGENL